MTTLTHTVEIQKPLKDVYDLAKQVEKYPEFLPGYVESRIIERRDGGALLQRSAMVRGKMVHWQSWVRWKENKGIHFIQKEGPLKGMWVNWHFVPLAADCTQLTITHLFEVNRPLGIGAFLEKYVFKPRLNEIASQVIVAFKQACEKRGMVPA